MAEVKSLLQAGKFTHTLSGYPLGTHLVLSDDGSSLHLHVKDEYEQILRTQLFKVLAFSEPLKQSIATTNSLAGNKTWAERGLNISWTYHPQNGLNMDILVANHEDIPDSDLNCVFCGEPGDTNAANCPKCRCLMPAEVARIAETEINNHRKEMQQLAQARQIAAEQQKARERSSNAGCLTFFVLGVIGLGIYAFYFFNK
jgi:hypothetical protein